MAEHSPLDELLHQAARLWLDENPHKVLQDSHYSTMQNRFLWVAEHVYCVELAERAKTESRRWFFAPKGAHIVYRAFGEQGELLYVGVTSDYPTRMQQHRSSRWWPLCTRTSGMEFPTRAIAMEEERRAISQEDPEFNVIGITRGR